VKIAIVNASFVNGEGDTVLIKGNKILKIGYEGSLFNYLNGYRKVDANGATILPALHDSHTHVPLKEGRGLDLKGIKSIVELREKIRKAVRKESKFIYGRGWDEKLFRENRLPTRWDIDDITGNIPVVITRICGHVALANTAALKLAKEKYGDHIESYLLREGGKPTGILYEKGVELVRNLIPSPTIDEAVEYIKAYLRDYLHWGIVYLNLMSVDDYLLKVLAKTPVKGMRIGVYLTPKTAHDLNKKKAITNKVRICGIKAFADGSFGGMTAYLREPYLNTNSTGKSLMTLSEFEKLYRMSSLIGGQLAVHAIGDAAIEQVLSFIKETGARGSSVRIEHASLTPPDIIDELSKVKPQIVVQPHFLVSDWWLGELLGPKRARWAYAFRSLINSGLSLYGSSDYPVEPINPYLGISASISRGMLQVFSYNESLSVKKAIELYEKDPCFGGSLLREGMEADLVVLDQNISSISGYDIASIRPELVITSGEVSYSSSYFRSKLL